MYFKHLFQFLLKMCIYCHVFKNERELDVFNTVVSGEDLWYFNLNAGNNSLKSSNKKHYFHLWSILGLIQFGLKARLNHIAVGFTNYLIQPAKFGRPY